MAEPAQNQIPQIGTGVVNLKGKIEASRRHEAFHYTRMIMPAVDEFSSPSTVEIRSRGSLGRAEDMITVRAKVGGYRKKPYRYTDKETGETRMVVPVTVTLDAIED